MTSRVDKLKIGLTALVGVLVMIFGALAQISIARYAAQTHVDVEALKAALLEEAKKGVAQERELKQQQATIADLSSGVKEAKREARSRPPRVIVAVPNPPLPLPVTIATPEPKLSDTNPKHGGLLGW